MPTIIVEVMPKADLLDPQGKAVAGALARTGAARFTGVRVGKRFELIFDGTPDDSALAEARQLADSLLSNSVIEDVVSVHFAEPAVADRPVAEPVEAPTPVSNPPVAEPPVAEPVEAPTPVSNPPVAEPVEALTPVSNPPVAEPVEAPTPVSNRPVAEPVEAPAAPTSVRDDAGDTFASVPVGHA